MKTKNKYTPGPWTSLYFTESTTLIKAKGHNKAIAEVRGDNIKPNAQLIAAAPEMFEALMKIYTKLCSEQFQYLQNDFENELINIEKAIQKARGE